VLREPGLRQRAREQFARRLSGRGRAEDSPVLARYSLFALGWSIGAALFAIAMTFRYKAALQIVAPAEWIVWIAMGTVWIAVFVPVIVVLARPLSERVRQEA
jgi:putative peptide zinc metalloprotease protein